MIERAIDSMYKNYNCRRYLDYAQQTAEKALKAWIAALGGS